MIDIYELPTLPTSFLRTSSPTSGEPLAPSGSLLKHVKFTIRVIVRCAILDLDYPAEVQFKEYSIN